MKNINITVENKRATVVGSPVIICGNSDYTVTFAFDSDWNVTGVRTARFVYVKDGKVQHEDVVFSGNTVAVPILSGIDSVKIGVFAGELRTTTPAVVRCGASILCGSGKVHEPTPDVYDQIMALFNDLAERGGFGATEAQAQQIAQNQADIAALVSGTKKAGKAASADQATNATNAGNANTLGGHGAEYFAPLSKLFSSTKSYENLDFDLGNETGMYSHPGTPSQVGASNYPVDATGVLLAFRPNENQVEQMYITHWGSLYTRGYYAGIGWSEWRQEATTADLVNYLPLTGGKVASTHFAPLVIEGNHDTYDLATVEFARRGTSYGHLGLAGANKPVFMTTGGFPHALLHAGNVGDYALPKTGGRIENSGLYLLDLYNTNNAVSNSLIKFSGQKNGEGVCLGYLGMTNVDEPGFVAHDNTSWHPLLHTGNSAKVHIGTSAPSDTSALWIDTSA